MTDTSAAVIWFELWVPDTGRARDFYGDLLGWTFKPMPEYDPDYWLVDTGEGGGIRGAIVRGEGSASEGTVGTVMYAAVENLTETAANLERLGGQIERDVTAIGDGTYFVLGRDPFGNRMGLWSESA